MGLVLSQRIIPRVKHAEKAFEKSFRARVGDGERKAGGKLDPVEEFSGRRSGSGSSLFYIIRTCSSRHWAIVFV